VPTRRFKAGNHPTFEEWIPLVFEHPARQQVWYWIDDADQWDLSECAATTVKHLHRLFSDPEALVSRYNRDDIGRGLWDLASSSGTNLPVVLLDSAVPIVQRVACIHCIADLYSKLFASICDPYLSHLRLPGYHPASNEANGICYMWWDVITLFGRTRHPDVSKEDDVQAHWEDNVAIERACLVAMERTLEVEHTACIEGALHGLGHWAHGYPEVVVPTINGFIASNRDLDDDLRTYALAARDGCVQ
jgi:hypothetical protein